MNYTIVAIALLMVSVPVAFAETFEIQTPWEESSGHGCNVNPFNEDQYICVFDRYHVPMTLEDLEEFRDVLTPEEFEQAREDIIGEEIKDVVPVKKQTPEEIKINNLQQDCNDDDGCSYVTQELLNAYETMNLTCQIGIEEGARIQTFREFGMPEDEPDMLYKSVNLANYPALKDILLKIEECGEWNKYRQKYLRQYLDMELDDSNDMKYWAHTSPAIATSGKYLYADYFTKDLNPAIEEQKSRSAICGHSLYGEQFKKQSGCPRTTEYPHDPSLKKPMKDYAQTNSVFKEALKYKNGDESGQLHKNIVKSQESRNMNYGGQK